MSRKRRKAPRGAAVSATHLPSLPASRPRSSGTYQRPPVAQADGVGELLIFDDIGGGWMGGITAAMIREQLTVMGDVSELHIRINSDGGSVTEGMAIYSALRAHPARKVAYVEGVAASMASVILQAADERHVAAGSYVMIHNPSGGAEGESEDLRRVADLLDKMRGDLLDIYEARTKQPRSKLEGWVDAETWMSAEEAVANGFADVVDDITAKVSLQAVAKLKNVPEALRALAQKETPMAKMSDDEIKSLQEKCAALEEENARLKAEAEEDSDEEEPKHDTGAEDDDDGEESEDEPSDEEDEDKEAKALVRDVRKLTGAKSSAEARGRIMALAHKAGTAGRDSRAEAVSKLIAEGKLMPAQKSWALKVGPKAFAAYVKSVDGIKLAPVGAKHTEPTKTPGALPDKPTAAESRIGRMLGMTDKQILESRSAEPKFGAFKKEAN